MAESMLTTVDNPYDPFTQFDEWYAFDEAAGYHSSALLARIVRTSDDLSEADQSLAIEDAIDEVVRENVLGIYKKVQTNEQPVAA
jgi:hypothetical protein